MRISTRAVAATSLLLASSLLVGGTASSAQARTHSLAAASSAPSTCGYTGSSLSSITAPGPKVRAQRSFLRHHPYQWVRTSLALQAQSGSTWQPVSGSVANSKPQKAHSWAKQMPTLSVDVPATGRASAYRVVATVRWYRASGRKVALKQAFALGDYSTGTPYCLGVKPPPAPKPGPGQQSLAVAASAGQITRGQAVGGTVTVNGLTGSETLTEGLYNPGCGALTPGTGTSAIGISTGGGHPLNAVAPPASGYYAIGVSASGNDQTQPAPVACSGAIKVIAPISLSITTPTQRSVSAGAITASVNFGGFDQTASSSWTVTKWGPYDTLDAATNANCTGSNHSTVVNAGINANNGSVSVNLNISQADKFFRITATYAGSDLTTPASAPCSPVFHSQA